MLLNSFKVGGFKSFGDIVELNMQPRVKNMTALSENVIEQTINQKTHKHLKTAIIYGGNNTGKSSLIQAIMMMRKIFRRGDTKDFPLDRYKNFCFFYDDYIRFEINFTAPIGDIIYGIEFKDNLGIGEYLYLNKELLFSKDSNNKYEGSYLKNERFKNEIGFLSPNKLVVPFYLEFNNKVHEYPTFLAIRDFFNNITYLNNGSNSYGVKVVSDFMNDQKKVKYLNKIISETELYLKERRLISEKEVMSSKIYQEIIKNSDIEEINTNKDLKQSFENLVNDLRLTSVYEGKDGRPIYQPSIVFDSVGTNKFLLMAIHVINAIIDEKILFIDEFDSSLHHKLTRVLVILMNSHANRRAQFILTSHDVNLLSQKLFRKDQINFMIRDDDGVEIVSLDEFKANSNKDIRNTSNFEKMYVEEKIVPLPETDIYEVIKEFLKIV